MARRTIPAVIWVFLAVCPANRGLAASSDPWRVISISEPEAKPPADRPTAVIRFANGRELETHLHVVSVIGRLPAIKTDPYLVVGGSGCWECDANTLSVFLGRPTDWPRNPDVGEATDSSGVWFSQYPHRNYDVARRTLWDWSRLFVGHCMTTDQPVVVSFGAEHGDGKRTGLRWVDWAYVEGDRLSVHKASWGEPSAPALSAVFRATSLKSCQEVPPVTFDEPF